MADVIGCLQSNVFHLAFGVAQRFWFALVPARFFGTLVRFNGIDCLLFNGVHLFLPAIRC